MEQIMKHLVVQGAVLFMFLSIMWHMNNIRRWETSTRQDFEQALKRLNIEDYQLLVERSVTPGSRRQGNIYCILHDQAENYFFYQRIGNDQGVLKPLTKERALLAAKMNS